MTGPQLELVEYEIDQAEAETLRLAIYDKIQEAVSLGVFTDQRAQEWTEGFEACTALEHMENLVVIIDDFIASGLEVVHEINELLAVEFLEEEERTTLQTEANTLDYQEKLAFAARLRKIIKGVTDDRKKLVAILANSNSSEQSWLERFRQAKSYQKQEVVHSAVDWAKAQQIEQQRRALVNKIELAIEASRTDDARQTLNGAAGLISIAQYTVLEGRITSLEKARVHDQLMAA